jgi:glutamate dehydrogenase/leucine dehydrogenase
VRRVQRPAAVREEINDDDAERIIAPLQHHASAPVTPENRAVPAPRLAGLVDDPAALGLAGGVGH